MRKNIEVNSAPIEEIRGVLANHPRMHGYYLLKLVELAPSWRDDEDAALSDAFQSLDDHEWRPREQRPADQSWSGYEVAESTAKQRTISALVGGREVGHSRDTIDPQLASRIWDAFRASFGAAPRFFCGVGLGDSAYVYLDGAILVDDSKAGCLCVVEDD